VHASAAEMEGRRGSQRAAARHCSLGRETVLAPANFLVDHERFREHFSRRRRCARSSILGGNS